MTYPGHNDRRIQERLARPHWHRAQVPDSDGAITVTTTITDTASAKTMFGYPARHLKASIVEESSPKACFSSSREVRT